MLNVLRKCLLVVCILLIMCPKRSRIDGQAPEIPMQSYFKNWGSQDRYVIKGKPDDPGELQSRLYTGQNVGPTWSANVIRNTGEYRLAVDEPGFDLTDEEKAKFKLWPGGVILYYIDDFSYDKVLRDRIRGFLKLINLATGLHFLELPEPPEDKKARWVFFINRRGVLGCSDHTTESFTNEGVQKVVLGYDCMSTSGELAETVLALAGVPPQHNSPDRDRYISIEEENILPDKVHLFEKLDDKDWLFHDVEYDLTSAGHYDWHKYTANGASTIIPKAPIDTPVGEINELSISDIWKIRMLYSYDQKKKKTKSTLQAEECHKMFKPGANFEKFEPLTDDELIPRPKPNKYLGINEETPQEPSSTEIDEDGGDTAKNVTGNQRDPKDKNKNVNNKEYESMENRDSAKESNNEDGDNGSVPENRADENKQVTDTNLQKSNLEALSTLRKKLLLKNNPLEDIIDYNTDERKKIKKTKGKNK